MDLNILWFILLGVLLAGYAILDGFDLGVGILQPVAKTDEERRIVLNSIGPIWDGNEVWLVTFGGAMFAAFPEAYATVFSGFYIAFMLMLVRPDPAGRLDRVPQQDRIAAVAPLLGHRLLRFQPAGLAAVRHGRRRRDERRAAQRTRRVRRPISRPADAVLAARRPDDRRHVHDARRDLPLSENRRPLATPAVRLDVARVRVLPRHVLAGDDHDARPHSARDAKLPRSSVGVARS